MDDYLGDVVIPNRPCPPARSTLDEWYREADTLEHLHHRRGKSDTAAWPYADALERRRIVIRHCGEGGLSFDQLAALLEVDVLEVVAPMTNPGLEPQLLAAERIYREHPDWMLTRIYRAAGLSPRSSLLRGLLDSLDIECAVTARLKAGGGRKYSEEWYEALRVAREVDKVPWRQLARRYGLNMGTLHRLYHRRFASEGAAK